MLKPKGSLSYLLRHLKSRLQRAVPSHRTLIQIPPPSPSLTHTHILSLPSQTLWGPLGICGFAIEWLNVSMATIALNYRRCPKGCRHNWVPPGAKRSSAHSSEIRCLYCRKPPGGRRTHSLLSDLKNRTAQWEHQSSLDQIKASSNKFYCNWDQPQLDTIALHSLCRNSHNVLAYKCIQ